MVYTICNINFNFHSPCRLYTLDLTRVTFPTCIRYSHTKGVMNHFDFIRKRTLRMYNLEKLFVVQRITLDEYAAAQNVS